MKTNKTYDKAVDEIISCVRRGKISSKNEVHKVKRLVSKKYGIAGVISDADLYKKSNLKVFSRKPSRALSGVSVVAVMTSPAKCPHGKCVFCPGGVEFMTPQSYTGEEPAALRAKMNNYNAYKQVKNRLEQYYIIGQIPNKVELIIMGGTFTSRSWKYQREFVTDCFRALNNKKRGTLKEMQVLNETGKHRCVGLTIETRPDEINKKTIKRMLELGATRVELGVQSVYDSVLKKSGRGHDVKSVVEATRMLKDAGFKINYHIMTNMPGSDVKKDFECFKRVFTDSRFKPDMIKIYPTLLVKGTRLYEWFFAKKWKPYSQKQTIKLLARIKRIVPNFVRIMRLQRDIPSFKIEQDLKSSNLRQLVQAELNSKGWRCKCIRCREAGRNKGSFETAGLKISKYFASKGEEYFIEYCDKKDVLYGFIRVRIPAKSRELLVRELHVYGEQAGFGEAGIVQHKEIGKMLLIEAEKLAGKNGLKKVKVISGVGVRGYYRRLGYVSDNTYMSKFI
ncbi:MAG: tRNA uridine(34) 5-carboxymethylaminomethyl modification radical SAM/GNAT enzyme Elp3 [Nanoarchaeota archaeon]|nr:tRNA uridine(34) 5-carboxymethylaminomethyl modification radical SAM/GNAT enzyme Elp3 [Nanoarchaeota archaeon]